MNNIDIYVKQLKESDSQFTLKVELGKLLKIPKEYLTKEQIIKMEELENILYRDYK